MDTNHDALEQFLSLSVALTGFDRPDLLGTGLAQEYFQQVAAVLGEKISQELWDVTRRLVRQTRDNSADLESAIRAEILASPKFGPPARSIIQLWYAGTWIELPQAWRNKYSTSPDDFTHFTSAAAYQQGLIWKAMHTHPTGAQQPGFGSWSLKPV